MEVVVTSECSGQLWNACVWDPQTGTTLRTFKGGISASKSLHMIAGDYLLSAQKDKPILHVWALNRQDQSTAKMIVPGIIQVLAVSPCSTYCIGGSNEQLLVWQMSTGELVASLRRHYQDVTGICFTADGSRFVSAGAEGLVLVWSLETALLNRYSNASDCEPELTWSDHSLPVTGLCVTRSMVQPLVLSSSLDQTCRVRDLNTGNTLLSFQFNRPLHSVMMDWAEERVYVGSADGRIYQVDLLDQGKQQQQNKDQSDDDDETDQVGTDDGERRRRKFVGHEKAVTCLSVSIDGSRLLSGSEDGSCRLWDVTSGQCVRVLQHRGPITNAFFSPRCHHLQLLEQDVKFFRPSIVLTTPFEKKKAISGAKTSAQCLVPECPLLPAAGYCDVVCSNGGHSLSAMNRGVGGSISRGGSANEAGRQAALSDQVRHLKRLNHQLYTFAVDKILPPIKGNSKSNNNGGANNSNDITTALTTPASAGKKRRQEQHHQRSKSGGT